MFKSFKGKKALKKHFQIKLIEFIQNKKYRNIFTKILSNFNYYIELSNFINCKNANFGGAIFCENQESNLFITISLFYKCRVYNVTDSWNNNNKESSYFLSFSSIYSKLC